MMTIKFRGRTPKGELVYGDLAHWKGHIFINDKRVLEDTVAQLCGYDKNGDEIYEGDELIVGGCINYEARLFGWIAQKNGFVLK